MAKSQTFTRYDHPTQMEPLRLGAMSDGAPRTLYGPHDYGCFVRAPDGHKMAAPFCDTSAG